MSFLQDLIAIDTIKLTGVVTRRSSSFDADFQSLEPAARDAGIPCLNIEGNDQELMMDWIAGIGPEVIFCLSHNHIAVFEFPNHNLQPLQETFLIHEIVWLYLYR